MTDVAPGTWAIRWTRDSAEERQSNAALFGIEPSDLDEVIAWSTDRLDREELGWPNLFTAIEPAREFCRRFVRVSVRVIGVSLEPDLVDEFLRISAPRPQQEGYAPEGACGLHRTLTLRRPPERGGRFRGFEILGYNGAGEFDSFRCFLGLDAELEQGLRRPVHPWGLIDDVSTARRCVSYVSRPEVRTCATAWHAWSLTEYEA